MIYMIDKLTGNIALNDGKIVLSPNLSKEQFKKSHLYSGGKIEPSYSLKILQEINNKSFFVTLFFPNEFLEKIYLTEATKSTGWGDWSEEKELEKKQRHDKWLNSILGEGPYSYSWGEIKSLYDRKGGVSLVIIIYK